MVKYSDGLDDIAAAMASARRRHIVDRLRSGPATTTELAELLEVGLPALTKHLTQLADCGVVRRQKVGRVVHHVLDPDRLEGYSTWLAARRSFWDHQLDALEQAVGRS